MSIFKQKTIIFSLIFMVTVSMLPMFSQVMAGDVVGFDPNDNDSTEVSIDNLTLAKADVFATVSRIINIALTFLGIISLILILYAGFIWMWARGNTEDIDKAKDILKGAFIGLVIVLASYSISYYVFSNLVSIISSAEIAS